MPYIFLRIAWMKHYQGVTDDDVPTGAGSYVEENQDGGEAYNFYPIGNYYYGFAQIQGGKNLRIERLGAKVTDAHMDGVTVVLFAKNPETGGQYIVGWYRHATLFRSVQEFYEDSLDDWKIYLAKAKKSDSYLVLAEDRIKTVEGPGESNVWYVEDYVEHKYLTDLETYISDPENYILRESKKYRSGKPWQKDIEFRKKIEETAMEVVENYFAVRGYEVKYCHRENLGWDMEASLGKQTLLLEVKGLSGDFSSIELTPNEYFNSKRNRKRYRICVVSNALNDKKQQLDIFFNENGKWLSIDNNRLKIEEIISAKCYK